MVYTIKQENLKCLYCDEIHSDIDVWAFKPHKTHLCLNCNRLFEGSFKGVSHPTITENFSIPHKAVFVNEQTQTYFVNNDIKLTLHTNVNTEALLIIGDTDGNEHGRLEGIEAENLYNDVVNSDEDTAIDLLVEYV